MTEKKEETDLLWYVHGEYDTRCNGNQTVTYISIECKTREEAVALQESRVGIYNKIHIDNTP